MKGLFPRLLVILCGFLMSLCFTSIFFSSFEIRSEAASVNAFLLQILLLSILYFISIFLVWRFEKVRPKGLFFVVVLWAIIFRLLAFAAPWPDLSTDIWRYSWESRLVSVGGNPYLYAPSEFRSFFSEKIVIANKLQDPFIYVENEELSSLVDHAALPALYPAAGQYLNAFFGGSRFAYRVSALFAELLSLFLLSRLLASREQKVAFFALYAWLPLAPIETVWSFHLEAFLLPVILLGLLFWKRANPLLALVTLSLATFVKYIAIVALGFCSLRVFYSGPVKNRFFALLLPLFVVFLLYFPFYFSGAVLGSTEEFAKNWKFNAFFFPLLEQGILKSIAGGSVFKASLFSRIIFALLGVFLGLGLFVSWLRERVSLSDCCLLCLLYVLLISPLVYPWYWLWVAVLMPLSASLTLALSVALFACGSLFSYSVLSHPSLWELSWPLRLVEYLPGLICLGYCFLRLVLPRAKITQ